MRPFLAGLLMLAVLATAAGRDARAEMQLQAALGWFLFTALLGIGDEDVFDLGGILSAIIGVLIVLPIAGFILRRTGMSPERPPAERP